MLEQVLDIVCAEAQGLVGATSNAVLLLTDQAWLEVKHRLGKPLAAAEPVPVDGSVAGQVVRQGAPVRLNDPASFAQVQVYQWPSDLTALLAVPLHVNGAVIGVLDVVNKVGGFTEDDVPIMSVFANQAAMAIEHARLQEQAEQLTVLAERQRLARELHDSVTQSLYSVTLYANAAALALAADKQRRSRQAICRICRRPRRRMRHAAPHLPVAPASAGDGRAGGRIAVAPGGRRGRAGLQTETRVESGGCPSRSRATSTGSRKRHSTTCANMRRPGMWPCICTSPSRPFPSKWWMMAWVSIRKRCPSRAGRLRTIAERAARRWETDVRKHAWRGHAGKG
ncbi:MAG: GAF domain-containing protein [Anaerolineae bacterium]|nr:GAF domain-containing protein [Anaerolineae bacterium]